MSQLKTASASISTWKGVKTFLLVIGSISAAFIAIDGANLDLGNLTWAGGISLVVAALRAGVNYWKHSPGGDTKAILPFVLVLLLPGLLSCTTVRSEYSNIDSEGGSTTFTAKSSAAPFGKIDTSLHEFSDEYGLEGGTVTVGQAVEGMSNEAQLQALTAGIDAFAPILNLLAMAAGNYIEGLNNVPILEPALP